METADVYHKNSILLGPKGQSRKKDIDLQNAVLPHPAT